MLQEVLDAVGGLDPEVTDTAVLLASELAENAVLHAGTEFELSRRRRRGLAHRHRHRPRFRPARGAPRRAAAPVRPGRVPRPRAGPRRAASPPPGAPATTPTGGTRSGSRSRAPRAGPSPPRPRRPTSAPRRVSPEQARRLLHVPAGLADRLQPLELVEELVRRLRDVLDVRRRGRRGRRGRRRGAPPSSPAPGPRGGDGRRSTSRCPSHRRCAARSGCSARRATATARDATSWSWSPTASPWPSSRAGCAPSTSAAARGWPTSPRPASCWGSRSSWSWRSRVVPQVVVPRLGRWCAVYLSDAGTPRLAALTHADENELPELRAALDPDARPGPPRSCAPCSTAAAPEAAPVRIATPTDGLAVSLRSRGTTIGTLLVGRPDGRPHAPEDVVLVADIARRAALAVQNAQSAAAHVAVSQALQQALLPRALPAACRDRPRRRSTCPRAAAPTSAATSTTSSPSTATSSSSRSATSAARAPAPRPAPVSSATSCACWCAAGAGSPRRCTCSTR